MAPMRPHIKQCKTEKKMVRGFLQAKFCSTVANDIMLDNGVGVVRMWADETSRLSRFRMLFTIFADREFLSLDITLNLWHFPSSQVAFLWCLWLWQGKHSVVAAPSCGFSSILPLFYECKVFLVEDAFNCMMYNNHKKMLRFNDRPVVTKHDFDQEWKETERFPGCWYTCVCVSAPCSSNAFFCHSNMCINTSLVCNGIQNCVFPWDESNCKGTPLVPKRCVTLSLKTLCAVTTMSCVVWCNMMHVTSGLLCHIEPPWGKFERYFCDRTLSQSFNFDPVTMVL